MQARTPLARLIFGLLALVAYGCSDDPTAPVPTHVRFETLAWGNLYQSGPQVGLSVITNSDEARGVASYRIQGAQRVLGVNYETEMVLIVFLGRRPDTGYSVTIHGLTNDTQKLTVRAVETTGCGGSRIVTYPIQIVKTDKFNLPVELLLQSEPCF